MVPKCEVPQMGVYPSTFVTCSSIVMIILSILVTSQARKKLMIVAPSNDQQAEKKNKVCSVTFIENLSYFLNLG